MTGHCSKWTLSKACLSGDGAPDLSMCLVKYHDAVLDADSVAAGTADTVGDT